MLILLILIVLISGAILLQITGIGASYKLFIDLLSALISPLLAFFVTLMSVPLTSFIKAIKHSILGKPLTEVEYRDAKEIFRILERNLIIATILAVLINAVGILGGHANVPNITSNQLLRILAAALLDPLYGIIYLLFLQGFKNRLKAMH